METRIIPCEEISTESFAAYGSYISPDTTAPDAANEELAFWNRLGIMDHVGNTSVCIVQTYGKNGLIENNLERHRKTCETLIPTDDIIVVVALTDPDDSDLPDFTTVRAFSVRKGSAVMLKRNTWHHAPLTVKERVNTFVVFDEHTPEDDLYVLDLPERFGFFYTIEI